MVSPAAVERLRGSRGKQANQPVEHSVALPVLTAFATLEAIGISGESTRPTEIVPARIVSASTAASRVAPWIGSAKFHFVEVVLFENVASGYVGFSIVLR